MDGSKEVLVTKPFTPTPSTYTPSGYIGWEPQNYLILSLCICFINPLMGPVAVLFSFMARRSFRRGDIEYTYKWGNYALFMCMLGIIATILFWVSLGFSNSTLGRTGGYYW